MNFDEKFIETLKITKDYCDKCEQCKFFIDTFTQQRLDKKIDCCQISRIAYEIFKHKPSDWDMDKIERIAKL